MPVAVPDVLAKIVTQKRAALNRTSAARSELERRAANRPAARDFRAALLADPPAIIAEVKKASPSKGVFTEDYRPADIAAHYAQGGAACLSVLTDEEFFKGHLRDMEAARAAVQIPVLRKDFTIDALHVVEAAAHGADAILLIAAILSTKQMRELRELAASYKMAAIVEVHNQQELDAALDSAPEIVGVNNRNLHTFEVSLETSLSLAAQIPPGIVKVSESGIASQRDVQLLRGAGFDAFLVGEHLMKAADPSLALRDLRA